MRRMWSGILEVANQVLSLNWAGNSEARPKLSEFMVSKFSRSRSNEDAGWLSRRWRCRGHALRTLKSQNAHRLRSLNAFRPKISDLNRRFVNNIHSKVFSTASSSTSKISTTTHYANQQSKILLRHRDAHQRFIVHEPRDCSRISFASPIISSSALTSLGTCTLYAQQVVSKVFFFLPPSLSSTTRQ